MQRKNQPQSINSVLKNRFFSGSFHEYDCRIRSSRIYPPWANIYPFKSLNRALCVFPFLYFEFFIIVWRHFLYGLLHVHQINHVSQIEIYWCRKYRNDFHFVNCCRLFFCLTQSHTHSLDFNLQFQVLLLLFYVFVFGLFSLFTLVKGFWEMKCEKQQQKIVWKHVFCEFKIWTSAKLGISIEFDEKEKNGFFHVNWSRLVPCRTHNIHAVIWHFTFGQRSFECNYSIYIDSSEYCRKCFCYLLQ